MTQRERSMLYALLGLLGVVAIIGVMFYALVRPLNMLAQEEELAQDAIRQKEMTLRALVADRKLIHVARERSLSPQPHQAAIEYGSYLRGVLKSANLFDVNFQGPTNLDVKPIAAGAGPKGKKTTQTILNFTVRAKGTVQQVVRALEMMQNTPVMHRVKRLSVDRIDAKDTDGRVTVQMDVEALILHNIPPDHKPMLAVAAKIDPPGTNPSREYAQIVKRNLFLGAVAPAPIVIAKKKVEPVVEEPVDTVDARSFLRLDHTVPSSGEAYIRNLLVGGAPMRIRPTAGFNSFKVWNEDKRKVLVQGKVLRVDQRDVYFSVGEHVYGWHIGHSIADALRRPLSSAELREAGLAGAEKQDTKATGDGEEFEP